MMEAKIFHIQEDDAGHKRKKPRRSRWDMDMSDQTADSDHKRKKSRPSRWDMNMIENCDRISNLHDSILHHIFSFLPTKTVAQTTILSKRWNQLWISVPYLDLQESRKTHTESFIKFVDNFFSRRDKSNKITKFRLSPEESHCRILSEDSCEESHVNQWITSAVRAGVEELDIYTLDLTLVGSLPMCLFDCNSLVKLKLDFNISKSHLPKSFSFRLPKLKGMHLRGIALPHNFGHLICNCQNLEYLFLDSCPIDETDDSSPSSRHDLIADDHIPGNLSSLKDVTVALFCIEYTSGRCHSLVKLLRTISNTKVLTLSRLSITLLRYNSNFLNHLPIFHNLKQLRLTIVFGEEIRLLAALLRCVPVVEYLEIGFKNSLNPDEGDVKAEEFPRLTVASTLKRMRVDRFGASKNQCEIVRQFLANAPSLEKLIVQPRMKYAKLYRDGSPFWPVNADGDLAIVCEELLQFPRLSTSCIIETLI